MDGLHGGGPVMPYDMSLACIHACTSTSCRQARSSGTIQPFIRCISLWMSCMS